MYAYVFYKARICAQANNVTVERYCFIYHSISDVLQKSLEVCVCVCLKLEERNYFI